MPRRIDIELTSSREDGTWTWRAAGAKAPKGVVAAPIIPDGTKVGDVLKVDAEFYLEGIEITGVVPVKGARKEAEKLELIAPEGKDEPLVTTQLASRGRDDRGPRRPGGRREGGRGDGPRREGDRPDRGRGGPRREGERSPGGERTGAAVREGDRPDRGRGGPRRGEGGDRAQRRSRPEPPPVPVVERPKAKRLRAGKAHRTALLASLPEEQRPIAEQVVLGGLPAVRQAIEKQNAERAAAGEPAITSGPLLEMAEKLVPKVRAAEWRDRAEAAQRDIERLDLRDLRSVVSAADSGGKDPEARALAADLKAGLAARVDAEHASWLEELTATLDVGRIVRALRLSSRPPKAGSPLPPELATRLVTGASEALTADAAPERWVAVIDALAFAPVRDRVIPASLPTELHADVRSTIARLATRIPKIAHIFEITPDRNAPRPERRRPAKPKKPRPEQAKKRDDKGEEKVEAKSGDGSKGSDRTNEAEDKAEHRSDDGSKGSERPSEAEESKEADGSQASERPNSTEEVPEQAADQPSEAAEAAVVSPADASEGSSAVPETPSSDAEGVTPLPAEEAPLPQAEEEAPILSVEQPAEEDAAPQAEEEAPLKQAEQG